MPSHLLPKIDDGTAVPIAWLFKAFGFILVAAGVIWWGATLTANVKNIQQAVEPIPEMQRDIAVLKSRTISEALTYGPVATSQK